LTSDNSFLDANYLLTESCKAKSLTTSGKIITFSGVMTWGQCWC